MKQNPHQMEKEVWDFVSRFYQAEYNDVQEEATEDSRNNNNRQWAEEPMQEVIRNMKEQTKEWYGNVFCFIWDNTYQLVRGTSHTRFKLALHKRVLRALCICGTYPHRRGA